MQPHTTAVLGLGIIGSLWARNLEQDGLLGAAWNRSPMPDFPKWTDDPARAAAAARVVIVVVADPPAVESVLSKILPALTPDHTVVQCSTIDPESSIRFEALVRGTGAAYVESPFTGSRPAAEARKTVFFPGGPESDIARVLPVLERLSVSRHRFATGAQSATYKLACNLQLSAQLEALCEALTWCRNAGIDDETFFTALRSNAAWSPLIQLKEPKLRTGDFAPQFSVKHMLKDMRLAVASSQDTLPMARLMADRLGRAAAAGFADEDMAALLKGS